MIELFQFLNDPTTVLGTLFILTYCGLGVAVFATGQMYLVNYLSRS